MILEEETAQDVIFALAAGNVELAASLIEEHADASPEECQDIATAMREAPNAEAATRLFGDWVRSKSGPRWLVHEVYRIAFYQGPWWKKEAQTPLGRYFFGNKAGRPLDKWPHYFPIYERHLQPFVGTDAKVLEIGVYRAGGLDLLSDFLGPQAQLFGMDIDPMSSDLADPRFPVFLGSQSNPEDLLRLNDQYGPFDVIIDDGGHTVTQQITSAETLFPLLNDGGVYLVEDVHTSYWDDYRDAGDGSFLDWVRSRVDDLNAYHHSTDMRLNDWQTHLRGIHLYDSVVVLDRGESYAPFSEVAGAKEFARPNRERQAVELWLMAAREAAEVSRDRAWHEVEVARSQTEAAQEQTAATVAQMAELREQLEQMKQDMHEVHGLMDQLQGSRSWRLTAPLRRISENRRE